MATNAEVIKEFLVGLGFKIDEAGLRNFNESIAKATLPVLKLSTALIGMGVAIEAAALKVASNMERLYFAANRTGGTVAGLQAIEFAAGRIGLTSEQARAAVEGFAAALRSQPGLMGMLKNFGVDTSKTPQEMMMALVGKLRSLPPFIAQQIGQMFGLDPTTLLMMEQGYEDLAKSQQKFIDQQKNAGVDAKDLGDKSHDLMNTFRDLEKSLDILGEKLFLDIVDPVKHGIEALDHLIQRLTQLDNISHGGVAQVLADAAAGAVAGGAVGGIPGALGGAVVAGVLGTGLVAADHYGISKIGERGPKWNNPGNIRSAAGFASRGGFAAPPDELTGLAIMARQNMLYMARGMHTIAEIAQKYAPPGENDTEAWIRNVSRASGFGASQILGTDPETLQRLMHGEIIAEQGKDPFSDAFRKAAIDRVALLPSGAPRVNITQKTDIHVEGRGSPQETARAVAAEQGRVNGDLVRNLESNMR